MEIEYTVLTDPYTIQKVRNERYAKLQWSSEEQLIKNRPYRSQDFFRNKQVPFRLLAEVKFKRSLFGIFLNEFNRRETQDYFLNENKLAMMDYDHRTFSENELKHFECDNNFALDLRKLLEKAVKEREVIDYQFLYDNILALRFCDTPLTFIDSELLKFRRLKILILCANWITDLQGCNLPRSLEYIELFANQIEFLDHFVHQCPKNLVHIGLKRNWLTSESRLHLLGKPGKFNHLQSLDLSENDIYDLDDLLHTLTQLKGLFSLNLQGNPCSVITSYKEEVLKRIPWLGQLDHTEILEEDRNIDQDKDELPDAAIIFTCHRVMALPKPKPQKGIKQQFYFSISMPLLEDIIIQKPPEEEEEEEAKTEISVKDKKAKIHTKKKIGKSASGGAGSPGGKHGKIQAAAPYNKRDEYAIQMRRGVVDTTFKTERFEWSRIMQLPEEALVIKSSEGNFADIRDTFRSSVCVKLIFIETEPISQKSKKKPLDKKTKTKKKKDQKNAKKSKTPSKTSTIISEKSAGSSTINQQPEEPKNSGPKEKIRKKITLAAFNCDLHSINWSDKTIDFIWADHKQFSERAVEVEGSLRSVVYNEKEQRIEKTSKKTSKKTKTSNSKTGKLTSKNSSKSLIKTTPKIFTPKVFTIQVGFGLKRTYFQT